LNARSALLELKRKSIHMIPGFAAIPVVVWLGKVWGLTISALFLALYTLNELHLKGLIRRPIPIATHTFRIMARREELEKRTFAGTIMFWASTLTLIAFLNPLKAAAAIMVSSLGDAAAAIFGKLFGGPRIPWTRKTIVGTVSMFLVSTLCVLVVGLGIARAVITSLSASVAEAFTAVSMLDELTVPAAAGIVLALL